MVALAIGNAPAVVAHQQRHFGRASRQDDLDPPGLGVPDHVGQRLLQDAEGCRRSLGIQGAFLHVAAEGAANVCSPLEFLELPLDGRFQSKVVQDARPQFGRYLAHRLDRGINQPGHRPRFVQEWFLTRVQMPLKPGQVHFQSG